MSMAACRELIVSKLVAAVQEFFAEAAQWPEGERLYVAEYRALRLAQEIARSLGPVWLATPSPCGSLIRCSLPVDWRSPRTRTYEDSNDLTACPLARYALFRRRITNE